MPVEFSDEARGLGHQLCIPGILALEQKGLCHVPTQDFISMEAATSFFIMLILLLLMTLTVAMWMVMMAPTERHLSVRTLLRQRPQQPALCRPVTPGNSES